MVVTATTALNLPLQYRYHTCAIDADICPAANLKFITQLVCHIAIGNNDVHHHLPIGPV
jgi:hypothetical protein